MIIETKYNLKDRLWYIENNRIIFGTVCGICINVRRGNIFSSSPIILDETTYKIDSVSNYKRECDLYLTKEELINNL